MNKEILRALGFGKQLERIDNEQCPTCGKYITVDGFKEALSRKEYGISGLCQECQDKTFVEEK